MPQRLHFVLQQMYLSADCEADLLEYLLLLTRIVEADPEARLWVQNFNAFVVEGRIFDAFKCAARHSRLESATVAALSGQLRN